MRVNPMSSSQPLDKDSIMNQYYNIPQMEETLPQNVNYQQMSKTAKKAPTNMFSDQRLSNDQSTINVNLFRSNQMNQKLIMNQINAKQMKLPQKIDLNNPRLQMNLVNQINCGNSFNIQSFNQFIKQGNNMKPSQTNMKDLSKIELAFFIKK